MRPAPSTRWPSTATRRVFPSRAASCIAAARFPRCAGRYVFGDFGSGRIWHIARDTDADTQVTTRVRQRTADRLVRAGHAGELYVVELRRHAAPAACRAAGGGRVIPTQLSATGCVNAANATQPASGLIPYAPNAPFWSDGAAKTRWLALPDGQRITVNSRRRLRFPEWQRADEELQPRRAAGRDAPVHAPRRWRLGRLHLRVERGADRCHARGRRQDRAGGAASSGCSPAKRSACICHTSAAGRTLGLEIAQLNGSLTYPQTGRTANQLDTLNAIDTLTPALTQPAAQLPVHARSLRQRRARWRARACLSAHQLRQLPSARRRHAGEHGPALHHAAGQHQCLRGGAA